MDLQPWAKANRYRYRLEESYKPENNLHVRGDERWFIEVLCSRGLIYPAGGSDLLAFTQSRNTWRALLELGPDVRPHQVGDKEKVCRFPFTLLNEVAAIMRPRRRRRLDPDRARSISGLLKTHAQGGKLDQKTTIDANSGKTLANALLRRQIATHGI